MSAHQEKEPLRTLLLAVDTAVWAWAVKQNMIPGRKIKIDWKSAFDDLQAAYYDYELKTSNAEAILSNSQRAKDNL